MYINAKVVLHAIVRSYQESLELIKEIERIDFEHLEGSRYEKGIFFFNIGLIYERVFRYKKGVQVIHKARDIFNDIFALEPLLNCNIMLAILYNDCNDTQESEKFYEYSFSMIKYLPVDKQEAYLYKVYNNIGYLKEKIDDYKGAKKYYEESLKYHSNNDEQKLIIYINLIQCLVKLGHLDEAKEYYKKIVLLSIELNELDMIYSYQLQLLELILVGSKENYKELIELTEEALKYLTLNNFWTGILFYSTYLAEYFEKLHHYKYAVKLLKLALKASSIILKGVDNHEKS